MTNANRASTSLVLRLPGTSLSSGVAGRSRRVWIEYPLASIQHATWVNRTAIEDDEAAVFYGSLHLAYTVECVRTAMTCSR